MMRKQVFIFFLLLVGNSVAASASGFFQERSCYRLGWHFYCDPPPEEKKKKEVKKKAPPKPTPSPIKTVKKEETPTPPKPTYTGPPPLSAMWLKVNLPKYRNKAIDDPSPVNISAYLYLQKVMMEKATEFSKMAKMVSSINPALDGLTMRPFLTSGTIIAGSYANQVSDKLLKKMSKEYGLFFFFSTKNPYNKLANELARAYRRNHGFKVLSISLTGEAPVDPVLTTNWIADQGQAKKMGVIQTPAFFLVNPKTNEYVSIGQNTMSIPEFKKRLFLAALYKGWITSDEYESTRPVNNPAISFMVDTKDLPLDAYGFIPPKKISERFDRDVLQR